MQVYVVLDLLGAGRIVGVFDVEADAQRVIGEFREYYKLFGRDAPEGDPVWVVLETSGSVRVAAVTAHEPAADTMVAENPSYRSAYRVMKNRIDPAVVAWAVSDAQRDHLRKLVGSEPV